MKYPGTGHEYGLHCLLWLAQPRTEALSTRELAELQGVSATYLAKIFTKFEKAGILAASGGRRGGYRLARAASGIGVLDAVEAIGRIEPLFDRQGIRGRRALSRGEPPSWSTDGVCAVHAVMIRAEQTRSELARTSIAALASSMHHKAPADFPDSVRSWLDQRLRSVPHRGALPETKASVASRRG